MSPTGFMSAYKVTFRLILLLGGSSFSLAWADACGTYNGIVNQDPSVPVCCSQQCGECRGNGCSSRPGGKYNCCPHRISPVEVPLCSESSAPCRLSGPPSPTEMPTDEPLTTCAPYNGLNDEGNGELCCSQECGECRQNSCGGRPGGSFTCCPDKISPITVPLCSGTEDAPCRLSGPPSPTEMPTEEPLTTCAPYNGLNDEETGELCCRKECGACRAKSCGGLPGGADACCPRKIASITVPLCSEIADAPCRLTGLPAPTASPTLEALTTCVPYKGINDEDPTLDSYCCKRSCGSCEEKLCSSRGEKSDCCPSKINVAGTPICSATVNAPCRLYIKVVEDVFPPDNICVSYNGIPNDLDLPMACCNAACGQCQENLCKERSQDVTATTDLMLVEEDCCPDTIRRSQPFCVASKEAPCRLGATPAPTTNHCDAWDGINDEEVNVCCKATCGQCQQNGCSDDGREKDDCCPSRIQKADYICTSKQSAPCTISSSSNPCASFHGLLDSTGIPVCCKDECGACRQRSCLDRLDPNDCCPNAINREDVGYCSDTQAAPCRLPECPDGVFVNFPNKGKGSHSCGCVSRTASCLTKGSCVEDPNCPAGHGQPTPNPTTPIPTSPPTTPFPTLAPVLPAAAELCPSLRHGLCNWYQQCQLLGGKCYSANNDEVPCSAYKHKFSEKEETCPAPRCVWAFGKCILRVEICETFLRKAACLSGYGAFLDELSMTNCVWRDRKCTTIYECSDYTDRRNCKEAKDAYDCKWSRNDKVCRDAPTGCRRFTAETPCMAGYISVVTRELVECWWRKGRCEERLYGCAGLLERKDCENTANWPVLGLEAGPAYTVPCAWMKHYSLAKGRSVCIDGGCEAFTNQDTCVTGSGDLKCAWVKNTKDCITLEDCTGFDKQTSCLEFNDNMDCIWSKGICLDAPPGCKRFNTRSNCEAGRDNNMSPTADSMECWWKKGQCTDVPLGCGRYLTRRDCEKRDDWPESAPAVLCKWTQLEDGKGKICEESEKGCEKFESKSKCKRILGRLLGCVWKFQACRKYPDW